ncbi:ParA family protein [Clostridium autoethanogenum]|nr:AAA family ATPase [Clostridium autoethanogenum]
MTKVITTGNFKGGVGKTTNAVMIAYNLGETRQSGFIG